MFHIVTSFHRVNDKFRLTEFFGPSNFEYVDVRILTLCAHCLQMTYCHLNNIRIQLIRV